MELRKLNDKRETRHAISAAPDGLTVGQEDMAQDLVVEAQEAMRGLGRKDRLNITLRVVHLMTENAFYVTTLKK
jgi:hypothetical protein